MNYDPSMMDFGYQSLRPSAQPQPTFLDRMTGYTSQDGTQIGGWGSLALGGAQTLLSGYMGLKQLGLAEDSLKQNKRQFNLNYNAQVDSFNKRLEDQANARYAANPNAYESPSAYMAKYKQEKVG